jgi:thymidylate kinase
VVADVTGPAAGAPAVLAVEGIPGSGKTAVVAGLMARADVPGRMRSCVMSPHMTALLPGLAGEPPPGGPASPPVPPAGFVRMAHVVDAVMQFHYLAADFGELDWLLFDGWTAALDVYWPGGGSHQAWLRRFAARLPSPTALCYLRADPRTACQRLAARDARAAAAVPGGDLLASLRRAHARYEEIMAGTRCTVIDASRPLAAVVDEVAALARAASARQAEVAR